MPRNRASFFLRPADVLAAARNEVRISDLARGRLMRSRFATPDYRVSDLARGRLISTTVSVLFIFLIFI